MNIQAVNFQSRVEGVWCMTSTKRKRHTHYCHHSSHLDYRVTNCHAGMRAGSSLPGSFFAAPQGWHGYSGLCWVSPTNRWMHCCPTSRKHGSDNGADNVILWFQLLPHFGPFVGVHALPSVELVGNQKSQPYMGNSSPYSP